MIRNIRTGEMYGNRKEAKNRLGGLGAYNSAMRRGELLFINCLSTVAWRLTT